jgi:acetylornithine deacetylase/succinyl-diaminopimelate desuccinylase-like protein
MPSDLSREGPIGLLQQLLRFDTSNPPGNEGACIDFVDGLLREAGVSPERVTKETGRPNLVARLPGRGLAPALLFCGHVDVVPADPSVWAHPPFAGEVADGCVWGRGALDMKSGVAMMVWAFLRAARSAAPPSGDLVLALVADEESGGRCGARFLVEERPDLFRGVRHAIGEFGGFPLHLLGRTFYMIQVAEKMPVVLDVVARGPAGHGARPVRGGAMRKLARVLERLETHRLPVHITPVTRQMIEIMADSLPLAGRIAARRLLNPALTDFLLNRLGDAGQIFAPLFRNTVSATMLRGSDRLNVIPSEVHLGLDARILPGYTTEDLLDELRPVLRADAVVSPVTEEVRSVEPDLALFDLLGRLLQDRIPGACPVPYLLPASTDGRHLARLGIRTYGYTPMTLPPDVSFFSCIHAANERVPLEAVQFGADVLYDLIQSYGTQHRALE